MNGKGDALRARGFDESSYDTLARVWRVRCSACSALVINGIACHETGCQNRERVKQRQGRGKANRLRQERS